MYNNRERYKKEKKWIFFNQKNLPINKVLDRLFR